MLRSYFPTPGYVAGIGNAVAIDVLRPGGTLDAATPLVER
jgi:hypothetical protein